MGCKVSKVEDLPLVVICKKRKDLIRAAADHRYALAVAHISYFSSLRDVGDALHRFVDEDLLIVSASSSSSPSCLSSPVLTLPSDEGKSKGDGNRKQRRRQPGRSNNEHSSSSTSISHSISNRNAMNGNRKPYRKGEVEFGEEEEEAEDSEICFSSVQSKGSSSSSGHVQVHRKRRSPKPGISYSPLTPVMTNSHYYNPDYLYGYPYNSSDSYAVFNPSGNSYGAYYMKKDSARIPSVIYEEPEAAPIYAYSGYGNAGDLGFEFLPILLEQGGRNKQEKQQKRNPVSPTPPSPKVSTWDYFNPFEDFGATDYSGYYVNGAFGHDSDRDSSDSREVREREGIPDLEEDSETELFKDPYAEEKKNKKKKKKNKNKAKDRNVHLDETVANDFVQGNFNGVPLQHWQQMPKPEEAKPKKPQWISTEKETPVLTKEVTSSSLSSDISIPVSVDDVWLKGGGVRFEMDEPAQRDVESPKLSSLTTFSAHGTRDLREVVGEVQDEFEAAIDYGHEVCQLLEVGKLPYQPKSTLKSAMLARMPCPVEESVSAMQPQPRSSISSDLGISRMRRAYVCDLGDDIDSLDPSLVSTLDKLYVWEKKLYKEVKDEEKLRIMYEKKCTKLKLLYNQGADVSKIEATQELIKQLSTRINLSIKTVDGITRKIHQIRDKELQPQLRELILGLRRMWRLMLNCHQKQLQAIIQTKINKLKGNTNSYTDSSARATAHLETEILNWCNRFNHWIELQKSYVQSLNAWLLTYITYQPEDTPDGPPPFSPGQLGAPQVFIICHDWLQAMERISNSGVSKTVQNAMNGFASILHELCEKQEEEQCHRQQAEHMLNDFERQIHAVTVDDVMSEKGSSLSMVPSDLGSLKQRVKAERAVHKEAVKLVHSAVSRSIKAGFIPIFEALESFTAQAVKAYDDVRLNEA